MKWIWRGACYNRSMVIPRICRVVTLCFAAAMVAQSAPAQTTSDARIVHIRQQYEAIDSRARRYTVHRYEATAEGSSITYSGFSAGKELRKVVAVSSGERDQITTKLYLEKGQVIFVHRITTQFASLADNKGTKTEERFYFAQGKLIRWLGAGNVAKVVEGKEARDAAAEIRAVTRKAKNVLRTGKIKDADW